MKSIGKKKIASLGGAILLLCATWYLINLFKYTLSATVSNDGKVLIQTLSLGEYYTPVSLLEVYELESGQKVVSFISKNENARMHTVTLASGVNQFNDLYIDGYSVHYTDGKPYSFVNGEKYLAKVGWVHYKKEIFFVLPNGT